MNTPRLPARLRAFTLIELVVVIAVIAIIASFTIPAVLTMLKGSSMTQGSQLLVDQLALARQQALSKNATIEVRFYRYGDPETPGEDVAKATSGKFRALQIFEVLQSGAAIPLGKVNQLPNAVIFSADLDKPEQSYSSLLVKERLVSQDTVTQDRTSPDLPRGIKKNYDYVAFRFAPDGSTNLPPTKSASSGVNAWYVTLHGSAEKPAKEGGNLRPPPNFFTVQIDPVNGTTRVYRPTAG